MREYDQVNLEIALKINEKLMWLDKNQITALASEVSDA
jgi:hypothetical protein